MGKRTETAKTITWKPQEPNRGTVKTYSYYELYMAEKSVLINIWFLNAEKEEICKSILVESGKKYQAYYEAARSIPEPSLTIFRKHWINSLVRIRDGRARLNDNKYKSLLGQYRPDAVRPNGEIVEMKTDRNSREKIKDLTNMEKELIQHGRPFLAGVYHYNVSANPKVKIEVSNKAKEIIDLGTFSYRNQNELLIDKFNLLGKEINLKELAEKLGFADSSMISKHLQGEREITREQAIIYGKYLGCDPADILFPKPLVKVWAHINFLNFSDANIPYSPGELIPQAEENYIECPRDIYRPDIKAIRVKSTGSYLDNHIIFYYNSNRLEEADIGKLCVVGCKEPQLDPEFEHLAGGEHRYFCGVYESYRGKRQFLNPDPFAKDKKIDQHDLNVILNDNWSKDIFFTAPVVAVINPAMLVENKKTTELFRQAPQVKKEQDIIHNYILKQQEAKQTKEKSIMKEIEVLKKQIEEIVQEANKIKMESKDNIPLLKEFYDNLTTAPKKRA